MARVIGIDLGAHTVKVAVLEVGFRVLRVTSVKTMEVLSGAGSAVQRSLRALDDAEDVGPEDAVSVGMPGDRVLLRALDVPAVDPRKLQAVVANELADDMPWEMEQAVFDHLALPAPANKVLAAAARSAEIEELLRELTAREINPRCVAVAPMAYAGLVRRLYPVGAALVIDIGHLRTNVCYVESGRAVSARTISRGGHQITEAVRQAYQLGYAEAEQLKETRGVVVGEVESLPPGERELAAVIGRAATPLVRELYQSLTVLRGRLGARPQLAVVCGGGGLLRGMPEYLGAQLGVPAARLSLSADEELAAAGLAPEGEVVSALSLGLALDHGRRGTLELRQGPFAFRADRSVFRDKVVTLAASVLAVLLFAGISAYAKLTALRGEETQLEQRLSRETSRVFGQPIRSASRVARQIKKNTRGATLTVASHTAADVLDTLSRRMPPKKEVAVDITRLDIKAGKTYLKGTADSQSAVGKIVKALKADDCFKEVSSGKVSAVGDGKREFTLTIVTTCF